jgi:hypothetical protein
MGPFTLRLDASRERGWRVAILLGVGVLAVAWAARHGPIPQPPELLQFADRRTLLGIPNALDVLSSAAFAPVGVAGIAVLLRGQPRFRDARERWPWLVLFTGVALTSVGSAWFHLGPSLDSLAWDRLPMTVGFMGLLAALVAERVGPRAGLALLAPLVATGIGSVVYWLATEHAGRGDLRPYLLVQAYPLAAILLVLALFPRTYDANAGWLAALGAYALAKWAEDHDAAIFAALRVVSGHTLKHLLAAAGVGILLAMLARRRPLT